MSPYRALPVVSKPRPRSVCVWCRHVRIPFEGSIPLCDAREHIEPDPVVGSVVVDRGRDCYVVRMGLRAAGTNTCPDFEPTVLTRVLRAIGGRR